MKNKKIYPKLMAFFFLIVFCGLVGLAQNESSGFLRAKIALAQDFYGGDYGDDYDPDEFGNSTGDTDFLNTSNVTYDVNGNPIGTIGQDQGTGLQDQLQQTGSADQSPSSQVGGWSSGEVPTSNMVDSQGDPIFVNDDNSGYVVYKNGEYQNIDANSISKYDPQTGQEIAVDQSGHIYYVNRDADGKPYGLSDDGKTKWIPDSKGTLTATDAYGNKYTLDADGQPVAVDAQGKTLQKDLNGNFISSQGNIIPKNSIMPTGYSMAGQSGMMMGGGGGLLGTAGSWVGNLLGLSGGIGYNQATGLSAGLGFNTSQGSGGFMNSLFGGGGAATSGYGYSAGQGWQSGAGMGTAGYSGMAGGGYMPTGGMYGMGGGMGWNPANYVGTGLPAGSIYTIIQSIVFWILAIFGFICIVGFVIAGTMYLLAAGDDKTQEKAKKALYYSITGVIVGLVGLVIIFAVNALLRGASYF